MEKYVQDFILFFTSILYEALPFIILGSVIAGFLEELVPQQFITRVIPRNRYLAVGISALLGLVFPMCECGIIPVMRRLLRKGLPLSCCVAYILAGPVINGVVMLSTYVAFAPYEVKDMGGAWMLSLRAGLAYLVAVCTALVVDRLYRKHGNTLLAPLAIPAAPTKLPLVKPTEADGIEPDNEADDEEKEAMPKRRSIWERLGNITETTLHDFVDICVFLILGALLSAYMRLVLIHNSSSEMVQALKSSPYVAIGFMMALAIVLCLCSEADAFVAANMGNVPPAAKLAFLVLGPMLDFKLYMMYTRVFRPKLIWTIFSCVVVQVYIYTLLVHFAWTQWMSGMEAGAP